LYSDVSEFFVGVSKDSLLAEPKPYKYEKPIVFYGSSITQGGCASRPGMAYESIVSRRFDADYLNLGFSGSAKGEEGYEMAGMADCADDGGAVCGGRRAGKCLCGL
jgi:hypothetical protein